MTALTVNGNFKINITFFCNTDTYKVFFVYNALDIYGNNCTAFVENTVKMNSSFFENFHNALCAAFFRGNNLFSIDNVKIMDPEHVSLAYPTARSFQLGLKLTF